MSILKSIVCGLPVLVLAACATVTPSATPTDPGERVLWGGGTGVLPIEARQLLTGAEPSPDWKVVEAPGWPSRTGFSLRLPPGWELNELQGPDSYVGEVVGDGVRLTFDYGAHSWRLDPGDDPAYRYAVAYESIGGVEAKLLISLDAAGGSTGVYFENVGGPALNLVGEGLTREQQRTAIAVFRSIRLLGQ